MANGHGGARKGSGRKKQKLSIKRVDPKIVNAGVLPLEMILKTARALWDSATDEAGEVADLKLAMFAANFAEKALPYTSAKLQSLVQDTEGKTPELLARQIKAALHGMDETVPEPKMDDDQNGK